MPMLERHQAHYGTMPRQLAADGGYATAANLKDAKDAGVADVALHKKRGLAVADMVNRGGPVRLNTGSEFISGSRAG